MGEVLKVSSQGIPFSNSLVHCGQKLTQKFGGKRTKQAVNELLEGIDPGSISAIGLTGQMHGMVALDVSGGKYFGHVYVE